MDTMDFPVTVKMLIARLQELNPDLLVVCQTGEDEIHYAPLMSASLGLYSRNGQPIDDPEAPGKFEFYVDPAADWYDPVRDAGLGPELEALNAVALTWY